MEGKQRETAVHLDFARISSLDVAHLHCLSIEPNRKWDFVSKGATMVSFRFPFTPTPKSVSSKKYEDKRKKKKRHVQMRSDQTPLARL